MEHSNEDTNVRVAVRCRPFNSREKALDDTNSCIKMTKDSIIISNSAGEEHTFAFDCLFDQNSVQTSLYESIGVPILTKAFSGYNGTIFAYGQTGSGKTWSMQGGEGDMKGIIPRMNDAVFQKISDDIARNPSMQFLVTASYFELYNEVIYDLLDPSDRKKKQRSGLEIKEHPVLGVYVKGLQEIVVDSPAKMQDIIDQGMGCRTVASTQMNDTSSRSHSVFTFKIHQKDTNDESKNLFAKVNLVDLAGSERVKSTGATGATLVEGANINKSLSSLGNVINALVEQAKGKKGVFIPYRNSKLTRVLQESLGGNSITCMLAALSPALCNYEETLSTLKYANRAKAIKVRAVKNDESSQISRLEEEIRALKMKLAGEVPSQSAQIDMTSIEEKHQQQLKELEDAMKNTWEQKSKISAEHEKERLRLQKVQEEAEKLIVQQREDNWKLLENKGDADLTINFLKELSRGVTNTGVQWSEAIYVWASDLKEIAKLDTALIEQDTIINIYQTTIHKDADIVLQKDKDAFKSPRNYSNIKQIQSNLWKQLRGKFSTLKDESMKWISIQENLVSCVNQLLLKIKNSKETWKKNMGDDESSSNDPETNVVSSGLSNKLDVVKSNGELHRGLNLLSNQLSQIQSKSYISRQKLNDCGHFNLSQFNERMRIHLDDLKEKVNGIVIVSNEETKQNSVLKDDVVDSITENIRDMNMYLVNASSVEESKGEDSVGESKTSTDASEVEDLVEYYDTVRTSTEQCLKSAHISSSEQWLFDKSSDDFNSSILISLRKVCNVSEISLRTGMIGAVTSNATTPKQVVASAGVSLLEVSLPSGLKLADCDGNIAKTVSAISDVLQWETLIKTNPPEKFLQRPPVRFLYDIFKHVILCDKLPIYINQPEKMEWDVVNTSKQSKMEFMDKVIEYVSEVLSVPATTTSSAIVTGADSNLTNVLLQQFSIAAYMKRKGIVINSASIPVVVNSPGAGDNLSTSTEEWIDTFVLSWSLDGENYTQSEEIGSGLGKSRKLNRINLDHLNIQAKFIKLIPKKCTNSKVAVRFSFLGCTFSNDKSSSLSNVLIKETIKKSRLYIKLLDILHSSIKIVCSSNDYIGKMDELQTLKKQEEVKQRLEGLAKEKMLLEQTLVNEKIALNSEKKGLEEQLKESLQKLKDTEELLLSERNERIRQESIKETVERDMYNLQKNLQEQVDENISLKSELQQSRETISRISLVLDNRNKRVEEYDTKISELLGTIEEYHTKCADWEHDREDLTNQIVVLVEERDISRGMEEQHFANLEEKTNDLEKLQESYVDMTDRCNNYQDELCELREQLDNLKESMLSGYRSHSIQMPTYTNDNSSVHSSIQPNRFSVEKSTLKVSQSDSKISTTQQASLSKSLEKETSENLDDYKIDFDDLAPSESKKEDCGDDYDEEFEQDFDT